MTNLNKNEFTLGHTQIAKGIAILLMVYHHLFVIPERLNYNYLSVVNLLGLDIQAVLANFSKICVCIFVFLSGIGLFYSLSKENSLFSMYKKVGIKALSFLFNFWIIAIILFPIGLVTEFFTFDISCIIRVVFADNSSVMEWWFVRQYIVLLIIAPPLTFCFTQKPIIKRIIPLFAIGMIWLFINRLVKFDFINTDNIFFDYYTYFANLPCILTFIMGFIFAKFNLFSYYIKIRYLKLCSILLICIAFAIRLIFSNTAASMKADFIVVPLFVIGATALMYKTQISKVLCYFAKHSTNIWLTHTFWCYYFFQNIVLKPYYSPLIYLWLLILSLLSSYVINLVYVPLNNLLFSKEHKLSYKNYFYLKKNS